jgi:hypothetical protein
MVENQKQFNPLVAYFRQPKIYITLPSQGNFYPDGALDVSVNGEYPVYAMTAKDELIFKTPDALLNGQATVELIKSCVPAVKDPWKVPSIDLDALLIAIRIATYGDTMDFSSDCPDCKEENTYQMNMVNYLEQVSNFEYQPTVDLGELIVTIRPYNYQEVSKQSIKAIEQQKIFNIVNDDSMEDDEKVEKFGQSFVKLTEMTVDVIAGCIAAIKTPTADVTDQAMIKEFINNAPKDVFNKISDHISEMKKKVDFEVQTVKCGSCSHDYKITLNMDQSNFFGVRS